MIPEVAMKHVTRAVALIAMVTSSLAWADVPPQAAPDQAALLRSADPRLAANKRLVYDTIRVVMIAGHVERIDEFIARDYIQHNPVIPSGRDAFVAFIRTMKPTPTAIPATVTWPIVTMAAERDLVTVAMIREVADPRDAARTVQTTWFDMYRIRGGRIVEHWDGSAGEHAKPPGK